MLLIVEIFSVLALLFFLIYLKRNPVKTFIKKLTSYKLFPKIFWGLVLGAVILCFGWIRGEFFDELKILSRVKFSDMTICIRGTHFIGPIFGIFVGIIIGASSSPFTMKKLLCCIFMGLIGGMILTINLFLSETTTKPIYTPTPDPFQLVIFSFALMPITIGIGDKSLVKVIFGIIGGAIALFLYFLLFVIGYIIAGQLAIFFNPHAARGFGAMIGMPELFGWEAWPICMAIVIGGILPVIGIELAELKGIFKH